MPKIPPLKARQLIKALLQFEFVVIRQRGSHVRQKSADGRFVSVPDHPSEELDPVLIKKILRDAEIDQQEFLSRLKE